MSYSRTRSGHTSQKNEEKRLNEWFAAIEAKDAELVRGFLEEGQNINAKNSVNFPAVFIMIDTDWPEGIELLAQYASPGDFDLPRPVGMTPLQLAILYKDVLIFETLIAAGANVLKKENDESLLHWAMEYHNEFLGSELSGVRKIMTTLIEQGCSVTEPNQNGVSFVSHISSLMEKAPSEDEPQLLSLLELALSQENKKTLEANTPKISRPSSQKRL